MYTWVKIVEIRGISVRFLKIKCHKNLIFNKRCNLKAFKTNIKLSVFYDVVE